MNTVINFQFPYNAAKFLCSCDDKLNGSENDRLFRLSVLT
jgi:hypothetical protein